MNNITLLKYEIRRVIISKKYFYMILLIMGMTYDFLTRLVTGGYYGTAPFSEWTYTFFIQLILPAVISVIIFMMTNIFDEKELRARKILFSAPISQSRYYMLKILTIAITFVLTALVPIVMSFIYYKGLFNYVGFASFTKFILWFFIPAFIFFLGLSMILGKISIKFLYGLIPVAFLLGTIDTSNILPDWLDIFGTHYFRICTFTELLGRTMESVPFNLSSSFIHTRLVFVLLGVVFLTYTCVRTVKE
ncbi:hypothetical protein [Proteiniborus sp. MB09-C3]|uniref:hypothetical protein n=1 Tax=Proteiniborus sp. MB09-C3 TaxID=3050072 RepID=UPI00255321CF|nr:hypothetical protein [Proteiniborus sp. MB09-C3]WIV11933.1 hypothetical protein QO263_17830 [Proteiniborus sp. MB09-C3]